MRGVAGVLVAATIASSAGCSWIVLKRPADPPVVQPHCADTVVTTVADTGLMVGTLALAVAALRSDGDAGPAVAVFAVIPLALGIVFGASAIHGVSVRGDCKRARDAWNAQPHT